MSIRQADPIRKFSRRKTNVALGCGLFLTLLCGTIGVLWPVIFNAIFDKEMSIRDGSRSFQLWQEMPVPACLRLYFYNCTNSDDVMSKGAKPHLVELGPYAFIMNRKKVGVTWGDGDAVGYYQNSTWWFDPSRSNGSLSDVIVSLNVPALTASTMVMNNLLLRKALATAINAYDITPFVARTVDQLAFAGYSDILIDLPKTLGLGIIDIPYDKFGWFYGRNGSAKYDGHFMMDTGRSDINHIGDLLEWNNKKKSFAYESYCSMINGSAGELFPPKRTKTSVTFFLPDLCRSVTLPYKEDIEFMDISGYRYWAGSQVFANGDTVPDNWCFEKDGKRWPDGAVDVSKCKLGAPALVSHPHFFQADPSYLEAIDGVTPGVEERHQMYLDLEPDTGLALEVAARLQINLILQPISGVSIFETAPNVVFPMFWFEMNLQLSEELADEIKLVAYVSPAIRIVLLGLSLIGCFIVFVTLTLCVVQKRRKRNTIDNVLLEKNAKVVRQY